MIKKTNFQIFSFNRYIIISFQSLILHHQDPTPHFFQSLAAVILLVQVLNPAYPAAVGDPAYLVHLLDYPEYIKLSCLHLPILFLFILLILIFLKRLRILMTF
jgi:hypothetical protein